MSKKNVTKEKGIPSFTAEYLKYRVATGDNPQSVEMLSEDENIGQTQKMPAKILLIDDEIKVINALKRVFNKEEYEVLAATSFEEAIKALQTQTIDLIICDQYMPDKLGIDILKYSREILPDAVRILITGSSDINVAISAINQGSIYHYFSKPWNNDEIIKVVREGIDEKRIKEEEKALINMISYSREDLLEASSKLNSINSLLEPLYNPKKGTTNQYKHNQNELKNDHDIQKISVWEDDYIILIDISDICYMTAADGNVLVVSKTGRYKSPDSLNSWEQKLLSNNFFRCHRGYLVNINQIEKISPWFNGAYNLKLKDIKEDIPVSRYCTKELKNILGV